jgi:L-2-hydroxyglutarate oxidase LhgO
MEQVDCVVIGAGVVGLAIARQLAMAGREVLICEAEGQIGQHCSSRNSEVIHAGLYYPTGSLKARLCVQGRAMLYRYCAERHIPHQRIGKLLLANTAADLPRLQDIARRAAANGVDDLQWLDAAGVRALEPQLHAHAALLSPSTGIIDSHALLQALLADAEAHGAQLACHSPLSRGRVVADGMELEIAGITIQARLVINAAGPWAPAVAASMVGVPRETIPTAHYARGVYFSLSGRSPFSRLIYPLPEAGGLGCHLTLDLAGQARFGPDVEWIDSVDYRLNPARADAFITASAAGGRSCRTARCSRAMPGCAPNWRGRASRMPTLSSRGRHSMACRADQPVRHRIPRPDQLPGAGGDGGCHGQSNHMRQT